MFFFNSSYSSSSSVTHSLAFSEVYYVLACTWSLCKGTSWVSLSKSGELVFTKSFIFIHVLCFLLFLTSLVCIMQCNAFYSILGQL